MNKKQKIRKKFLLTWRLEKGSHGLEQILCERFKLQQYFSTIKPKFLKMVFWERLRCQLLCISSSKHVLFAGPNYLAISLEDDDLGFWHVRSNLIFLCLKIYCVLNNNTFKLFWKEHIDIWFVISTISFVSH